MSAETNCDDFALPDKLYMASSLLDFALYALSAMPGNLEMPEKSGIGLCYMLGHCQNLIDTAEQESAALIGEKSKPGSGKNSPKNPTVDWIKVTPRGTGDPEAENKNADAPGVNGGAPNGYGTDDSGTNAPGTNVPGTNVPGTDNPGTPAPGAAVHTMLNAVWSLPRRQTPGNNKWHNKVAAWCSIITAKRAGRPGGRPGQPALYSHWHGFRRDIDKLGR